MRPDMAKVIIDLPRRGSHFPNRGSALKLDVRGMNSLTLEDLDEEDFGPLLLPMSPRNRYSQPYGEKDSSDRLNPLRRFLQSQVGRSWNKVHEEMSLVSDRRSKMMGWHFWVHVNENIVTQCFVEDGIVYTIRWGRKSEVDELFVHPETGILCYKKPNFPYRQNSKYRQRQSKFLKLLADFGFEFEFRGRADDTPKSQNFRIVDDLTLLEKKSGIWFMHTFVFYKPDDVVSYRYIDEIKIPVFFKNVKNHKTRVKASCHQLSKKELKQYSEIITGNPF